MLHFNTYPPEQSGDVELQANGTLYNLELVRDENHTLISGAPEHTFSLLGMTAAHSVSGPRIKSELIDAEAVDTLTIMKPVVDRIGEDLGDDEAVWFARGVLSAVRVDFPEFKDIELRGEAQILWLELICGVDEEAAASLQRRKAWLSK